MVRCVLRCRGGDGRAVPVGQIVAVVTVVGIVPSTPFRLSFPADFEV